MQTYIIAQYRVSQRNLLMYFEWIYISILPPSTYFYGFLIGGGGVKMFLSILHRGRGEEMLCFNINPYLVTLLERYTFQKHHNAQKRILQHPWPKWLLVIIGQLSNFDRVLFQSGLPYTLHTCTLFIAPLYSAVENEIPLNKGLQYKLLSCPQNGSNILNFVFIDTLFNNMLK